MIALLFLLETILAPLVPPPDILTHRSKVFERYSRCLSQQALALEPSGADVDDIFEASMHACRREENETFSDFERRIVSNGKLPTKEAVATVERYRQLFVPSWKSDIQFEVLRHRADRKLMKNAPNQ